MLMQVTNFINNSIVYLFGVPSQFQFLPSMMTRQRRLTNGHWALIANQECSPCMSSCSNYIELLTQFSCSCRFQTSSSYQVYNWTDKFIIPEPKINALSGQEGTKTVSYLFCVPFCLSHIWFCLFCVAFYYQLHCLIWLVSNFSITLVSLPFPLFCVPF